MTYEDNPDNVRILQNVVAESTSGFSLMVHDNHELWNTLTDY
jgi:hypothetical protein